MTCRIFIPFYAHTDITAYVTNGLVTSVQELTLKIDLCTSRQAANNIAIDSHTRTGR